MRAPHATRGMPPTSESGERRRRSGERYRPEESAASRRRLGRARRVTIIGCGDDNERNIGRRTKRQIALQATERAVRGAVVIARGQRSRPRLQHYALASGGAADFDPGLPPGRGEPMRDSRRDRGEDRGTQSEPRNPLSQTNRHPHCVPFRPLRRSTVVDLSKGRLKVGPPTPPKARRMVPPSALARKRASLSGCAGHDRHSPGY